jgi:hypothetical protein
MSTSRRVVNWRERRNKRNQAHENALFAVLALHKERARSRNDKKL